MLISPTLFERLDTAYHARWGVRLCVVTPTGRIACGPERVCENCDVDCRETLAHATQEGLRWGEPTICELEPERLVWAVPLMHNARVTGGLLACITDELAFPGDESQPALDVPAACVNLRELAEAENLTNAALLEKHRLAGLSEQRRAEAIHDIKGVGARSILESYLRAEPSLLGAIRRGNRPEAVGILNGVLVELYHHGAGRIDLIKSFVMELVVTMCRTAVESGGAPEEFFGTHYRALTELGDIQNEEELSDWLARMLNRLLDSMRFKGRTGRDTDLRLGIAFIHEHFADPIRRDDAAAAARMSPSHFSRTLKESTGVSFTELLNRIRVDHAAEMLRHSDKELSRIAVDAGFSDQSYFTKVFRRLHRMTPRSYRESQRRDRQG